MKNTIVMKNLYMLVTVLLAVGLLTPVFGQEASKELKIKIVKDKNGVKTIIDTTLSLSELENLENNEELQAILREHGLDELDLDIDELGNVSVDIEEIEGDGEIDRIMVIKNSDGKHGAEGSYNVTVMKSDSLADQKKMRVMVDGGNYEYFFSDDDKDLTWVNDHQTHVEVVDGDEGRKVIVTNDDGSVEEYDLPEGSGTYMIGEDGEITKVDDDAVWINEGSEGKRVMVTVDDDDGAMVISECDQIIELNHIDKEGNNVFFYSDDGSTHKEVTVEVVEDHDGERKVRFERTVIVERIGNQELESLVKAGADLNTEGKDNLEVDHMKFHPNPSNGHFTLEFSTPETGTTQVDIYDINGVKVYEDRIQNFNGTYNKDIDISGEQSGTYFLKIQQGDKVSTRKIILE